MLVCACHERIFLFDCGGPPGLRPVSKQVPSSPGTKLGGGFDPKRPGQLRRGSCLDRANLSSSTSESSTSGRWPTPSRISNFPCGLVAQIIRSPRRHTPRRVPGIVSPVPLAALCWRRAWTMPQGPPHANPAQTEFFEKDKCFELER
jgi:hypothetical protein